MMRWAKWGAGTACLVLLASPFSGALAEDPAQPEGGKPIYVPAPVGKPKDTSSGAGRRMPVYIPPSIGEASGVAGGGVRGSGRQASLHLLAPDHVGLTWSEQPTLYWYLPEPSSTLIEITLRDGSSVKPLLEFQVPPPARAGVHAVRLADHQARLTPEKTYQWFVSIVPDPARRSRDFSANASIRRSDPPEAARAKLRLASEQHGEVFVYADNGVWYDAIDSVSSRIDAAPDDPEPRDQRAALLDQVGLSEIAAYDRSRLGAP